MSFELTEDKKEFARAIIGKALSDNEYKERLMKNPVDAIKEIYPDYYLAENTELKIEDQSGIDCTYLNISPLEFILFGGDIEELELSPEQLEAVAGGGSCSFLSCNSTGSNNDLSSGDKR